MTNFHVVTIFPEAFESYLGSSMISKAISRKKISVKFYNPRDFTKDKHKKVDARPYGGGPGMVMQAEPILRAVEKARGKKKNVKVFLFAPGGKQFTNSTAKTWSKKYKDVILIAGHYEGIDVRVKKILKAEEISVGPYILTGGELPAMTVIDATARQIEGVLGSGDSLEETRSASSEIYTRPEVLKYKNKNYKVPKVLLSGHHKDIEAWRNKKAK